MRAENKVAYLRHAFLFMPPFRRLRTRGVLTYGYSSSTSLMLFSLPLSSALPLYGEGRGTSPEGMNKHSRR